MPVFLSDLSPAMTAVVETQAAAAGRLARVESFHTQERPEGVGASAVLRSGTEVFIPLGGLIDLDHERTRLSEEVERLDGQLKATNGKLANENFVSRAPDEVVQKERDKVASYSDQIEKLREKINALGGG